jgi:hypothetical protein
MEQRWFRVATPDLRVMVVTVGFLLGLILLGVPVARTLLAGGSPGTVDGLLAVLVAAAILYRLAMAVRGYRLEVHEGQPVLWIERVLPGRRGVPLARLRDVRVEPKLPPILNTSMLSMGGLFGWTGPAMIRDLGNVDAYGTNNSKAVVLEFTAAPGKEPLLPNKKGPIYVVTPADPAAFVAAVRALRSNMVSVAAAPVGTFQVADLPGTTPAGAPPVSAAGTGGGKRRRRK